MKKGETHVFGNAHICLKMSIIAITFLFLSISIVSAEITWTGSHIEISGQNATISEINQAINNASILEEVSSKIWLLKAPIVVQSDAGLIINSNDCDELRMRGMPEEDNVYIEVLGTIEISNTTITSWNTTADAPSIEYPERPYIYIYGENSKVILSNSTFVSLGSGAHRGIIIGDYNKYFKNIYIENCTFTDVVRSLYVGAGEKAFIKNNNFTTNNMEGISIENLDGSLIEGNTVKNGIKIRASNVTVRNNSVLEAGWNGICLEGNDSIAIGNIVTGTYHNGMQISTKNGRISPTRNVFKNNEVFNIGDNGYYLTWYGEGYPVRVYDAIIEDCIAHDTESRGIALDGVTNFTARRYRGWNIGSEDIDFLNSENCYVIDSKLDLEPPESHSDIKASYSTNINVINTQFNTLWVENADITIWYYLDVLVQDENGNPVEGATVTVTHPNVTIDWYGNGSVYKTLEIKPINLHVIPIPNTEGLLDPQNISSTITGADGHTPLPSDKDNTLVIADYRLDAHGSPWYQHPWQTTEFNNWTITAEKDGVSVTLTGIDPDESWYRENPNTYPGEGKGTIVITLPINSGTGNISGKVINKTGAPIENATVEADKYSTTTDKYGNYIISNIPAGTYTVTASKEGYKSLSKEVMVIANETVMLNFTLSKRDAVPPIITILSPENRTYSTKIIPLHFTANEPLSACVLSVDATANQTLQTCQNLSVISREYEERAGTVGWWHFNGNAYDYSGNGNNGTIYGASFVHGKFGEALKFDGIDDWVEVKDPTMEGNEITIEAWIYLNNITGEYSIVNKYVYAGANERSYILTVEDGVIWFGLSSDGTWSNTTFLNSSKKIMNNTWTHIAAISDGKTMKIFINGVQDPSTKPAPAEIHDSPYDLYIGRWMYSTEGDWTYAFDGIIDEIRILNRALSEEEIESDYALGKGRHSVTVYGKDLAGNWNSSTVYFNIVCGNTSPSIIAFSPENTTPTQYVNRTYTFSVTVSQPVSNAWFLDGEDQHNNAQSWTHTWEHTGVHNVTYIGTNENGTVSLTWTVNVTLNVTPPPSLPSPSETLVYISPSSKVVKRGEPFNISIYVEPGEEIAGMQANLIFDPSFVHVNSVAEGDLLRNSGLPTFFIPGKINNTAGFVKDIACTILGKGNVSSPGTFAIINMTAGNLSGTSPLKIEGVKITNSYAQLLPHNISNGTLIVNDPPVLTPIGDKTVYEGSLLEFTVSAYDPDNDTLSFTAGNLPRGASFDPETRKFSWTPDYEQAGSYKVHFEVSDGYYNDSEDITITVINVNRPPKITYFVPENGSVFNESDVITIKVIASDPDNDNIYYEIKIDNVTVSTNSSYTWETNYSSAGEYKITACVSDGYAEVSETHTIIINNVVPRWDVNEDCVVDVRDLTIVGQHFGEEFISPPYPRYDVNADGVVDVSDTTIVGQHFGEMTCI